MRLEGLTTAHVEPLVVAAAEDTTSYGYTRVPRDPEAMSAHVDWLLAEQQAGEAIPLVQVRLVDECPVGMTRFHAFRSLAGREEPFAVEIGGTWLAASAQRTGINTEAKLLMISYAFDEWGAARVDFKTDARNERSRRALEGIGATFEGVLRNWQPSHVVGEEGRFRDSAMFSVTKDEWPRVAVHLAERLRR